MHSPLSIIKNTPLTQPNSSANNINNESLTEYLFDNDLFVIEENV